MQQHDHLAPVEGGDSDAEDGHAGNHSVPAMLRTVRILIHNTSGLLGSARDYFCETRLSTVMGPPGFKPGVMGEAAREKLYAKTSQLKKTLDKLLADGDEEEIEEHQKCMKDIHHLIKVSAEDSTKRWRERLPAVLRNHFENELVDKLDTAVETDLKRAKSFTQQCLTLTTGVKAGQPYKREQAVELFDKQIKFLVEKLSAVQTNKQQLTEARAHSANLRQDTTVAEQLEDPVLSEKLHKSDKYTQVLVQNMNSLTKEVIAEFNDGMFGQPGQLTSNSTLSIPNDLITKSRGTWVRQEIPIWYKNLSQELYPVIPYMTRTLNDYDALNGEYWKPPTAQEADIHVPETFLDEWHQANKALARMLVSKLNTDYITKFTCTFLYGANQDKRAKAETDDGLSLLFAMMTLSSPNSTEYRDSVDRQIHNCAELVASGNPSEFVKTARGILQEAMRLGLPVKWHVGKQIINLLTTRHALFSRDLGLMISSCLNSDDAATEFDQLLTKIEDINVRIKAVQGDTWWVSTSRANSAWGGDASEICRFGNKCHKKDSGECNRKHVDNPKGKGGRGKGDKKGNTPKGGGWQGKGNTSSSERCARKSCQNNKSHLGALCKGCFETARNDGSYLNAGGKRVSVKSKDSDAKRAKKAEAQIARKIDEGVKKALSGDKNTASGQLALTQGGDTYDETKVTMTIQEYNALQANKVTIDKYANNTDALAVIGDEIDKTVRGPTSYKNAVKLKFVNERTLKQNLPAILAKIKSDYGNK